MRKLILLLLSLLPIMGLYGEFGAYLGDKGGRKAGAFIYDFLYQ